MNLTRKALQQKIDELSDRTAVEEWILSTVGEEKGVAVCDDLDTYDWGAP